MTKLVVFAGLVFAVFFAERACDQRRDLDLRADFDDVDHDFRSMRRRAASDIETIEGKLDEPRRHAAPLRAPAPDLEEAPDPVAPSGAASPASCGVTVRVIGGRGSLVELELANVSDQAVEIGSSMEASYVDADGHAMSARMTPGADDWFMPLHLPAGSRLRTQIHLDGGDARALDRLSIPNSGGGFIPQCTVEASHLHG